MDYTEIKQLSKQTGQRVTDLIALAPQNDPFYTGTPNDWTLARWFADLWQMFGYRDGVHLRRIHYQVVSQDPPVQLPNGAVYENTMDCWELLNMASKAARYLGLVDASAFVDRRNAEAVVYAQQQEGEPRVSVSAYLSSYNFQLADFPDLPYYSLSDYVADQRYHLEIWCEKSTMNDILLPLCKRYQANLQIGSGELSITAALSLVQRLQQANRPARIFYVSDFDPAGQSMPVAMSRKVEYFVQALGLDLDIRVFPVVLTLEQVRAYALPRTPIKETERRRVGFEDRYGEGAVELDALEALYPGALHQILSECMDAYYDGDLEERVYQARSELVENLRMVASEVYESYQEELKELREEHEAIEQEMGPRLEAYARRLKALWQAIRRHLQASVLDVEEYPVPVPELAYERDEGLYNSTRDYLTQIQAYKEFQGKVLIS
jgi:hypothetical protein